MTKGTFKVWWGGGNEPPSRGEGRGTGNPVLTEWEKKPCPKLIKHGSLGPGRKDLREREDGGICRKRSRTIEEVEEEKTT